MYFTDITSVFFSFLTKAVFKPNRTLRRSAARLSGGARGCESVCALERNRSSTFRK